jgi:hypothetical protein
LDIWKRTGNDKYQLLDGSDPDATSMMMGEYGEPFHFSATDSRLTGNNVNAERKPAWEFGQSEAQRRCMLDGAGFSPCLSDRW